MKKKIITLFLMLITLCMIMMLSGCGENYPAIKIFTGEWSSYINIDVGKPYIYKGFDCNTCTKTCDYRQWGRQVTYNCPLWDGNP